jgi:hypothetical protein
MEEEVEHIDSGSRSSKEQWTRKVDHNIGQFGVEIGICNHHREQGLISIDTVLLIVESATLCLRDPPGLWDVDNVAASGLTC